ncbi:hypothetical protein ACJJTC_017416 [Scirpophaga incertulas]
MVQCKKCKLFLSLEKGETIRCKGPCESVYHKKCINVKLFHSRKELCETCFMTENRPQAQQNTMINVDQVKKLSTEEVLQEVNSKLGILYQLQKQIQDLTDTEYKLAKN